MYQVLDLAPDERLVCLFFRGPGESVDQTLVTDFERRPGPPVQEAGLSFFRRDQITFRAIVNTVRRKQALNRGMATITAGRLKELGFNIYGEADGDMAHICLHCAQCNGNENDCTPRAGVCPFIVPDGMQPNPDDDVIRASLSRALNEQGPVFEALNTRDQLLAIFGPDVSQENPVDANNIYEIRWAESRALA